MEGCSSSPKKGIYGKNQPARNDMNTKKKKMVRMPWVHVEKILSYEPTPFPEAPRYHRFQYMRSELQEKIKVMFTERAAVIAACQAAHLKHK
jgi:hypothetical protein